MGARAGLRDLVVSEREAPDRRSLSWQDSRVGDIDYIVDLCDEVLGSQASRQHVFPWLRDDAGAEAPVTAYYGDRQLAIEVLYESEDVRELDEGLRHRFATLLARGIQPGLLVTGMLAHDETGALRHRGGEDREILALTLESLVDEGLRHEFNVKLGLVDGWASYEGSYATFDADDGDWDDDGDDEWEEADEDERVSGVPQLGWRSRPIAQAILGGAVLARRAFGARYAGGARLARPAASRGPRLV